MGLCSRSAPLAGSLALGLLACTAHATGRHDWRLDLTSATQPEPEPEPAPNARPRGGALGTPDGRWWTVGATYAPDLEAATDVSLFASVSEFLVRDFEVIGELALWYFAQSGRDAVGLNPGLNLRWHIVNRHGGQIERGHGPGWSLFIDGGVGVLVSTANVPAGGTGLNFTPRGGVGITWRPNTTRSVYVAGLRWHHISNARIHSDSRNPDRDAPALYAGVSFGF